VKRTLWTRLLTLVRPLRTAPPGQVDFRDGVAVGAGAMALVALLLSLLSTLGPEGTERIVERGSVGPVAGPTREPAPAPTVEGPTDAASALAGQGQVADQDQDQDQGQDQGQDQDGDRATPDPGGVVPAVLDGPVARADALPADERVTCPRSGADVVDVSTAEQLTAALGNARSGRVIRLADGVYRGAFVARASGTQDEPIWLCGGRGAVLDGGGPKKGYALHLVPAQHWRIVGFTVRNAQKGVMADGTSGTVIQDLLVEDIGDEAIHLRSGSTGNAVVGNTIRRTGLRRDKFGEGVYIGSAKSNWSKYSGGRPDRSDYNLVAENDIAETSSESVDIKEGTTGGAVLRNRFDGSTMTAADSWVDVKGNEWLVADNTGTGTPKDGMQTHRILDGWGARNTFTRNTIDVDGPGLGIYIHDPRDTANVVRCDNRTSTGAAVTSSIPCTDG